MGTFCVSMSWISPETTGKQCNLFEILEMFLWLGTCCSALVSQPLVRLHKPDSFMSMVKFSFVSTSFPVFSILCLHLRRLSFSGISWSGWECRSVQADTKFLFILTPPQVLSATSYTVVGVLNKLLTVLKIIIYIILLS